MSGSESQRFHGLLLCDNYCGNYWEELPDDGLRQVERCNNQGIVLQVC